MILNNNAFMAKNDFLSIFPGWACEFWKMSDHENISYFANRPIAIQTLTNNRQASRRFHNVNNFQGNNFEVQSLNAKREKWKEKIFYLALVDPSFFNLRMVESCCCHLSCSINHCKSRSGSQAITFEFLEKNVLVLIRNVVQLSSEY